MSRHPDGSPGGHRLKQIPNEASNLQNTSLGRTKRSGELVKEAEDRAALQSETTITTSPKLSPPSLKGIFCRARGLCYAFCCAPQYRHRGYVKTCSGFWTPISEKQNMNLPVEERPAGGLCLEVRYAFAGVGGGLGILMPGEPRVSGPG